MLALLQRPLQCEKHRLQLQGSPPRLRPRFFVPRNVPALTRIESASSGSGAAATCCQLGNRSLSDANARPLVVSVVFWLRSVRTRESNTVRFSSHPTCGAPPEAARCRDGRPCIAASRSTTAWHAAAVGDGHCGYGPGAAAARAASMLPLVWRGSCLTLGLLASCLTCGTAGWKSPRRQAGVLTPPVQVS